MQDSTRALTSSTGSTADDYLYPSFGEELWVTGSTSNPFHYVGMSGYYRDAAERLSVRARHLNTQNGKWMSSDPLGFTAEDWNLYRYVENNPIRRVDPSGLWGGDVHEKCTTVWAKETYIKLFLVVFSVWCFRSTLSLFSHWLNPHPDSFVGDSSGVLMTIIFTATISYACFRSAFTSKNNNIEITSGCLQKLLGPILGAIVDVMATTTWIVFSHLLHHLMQTALIDTEARWD